MANNDLLLRRIPLRTVSNFRSLGGYAAKEKKVTRHGVLYRSAWICDIDEADRRRIKNLGIRTCVDLRERNKCFYGEHGEGANSFVGDPDVALVCVPLMEDLDPVRFHALWADDAERYVGLYKMLFEDSRDLLHRAIAEIAAGLERGAVVFNCAAGKDRTGMVAMLILLMAGVDDYDIIADYQISDTYISNIWPERMGDPHSKAEYMHDTLAYLRGRHGDTQELLAYLGVLEEAKIITAALLG